MESIRTQEQITRDNINKAFSNDIEKGKDAKKKPAAKKDDKKGDDVDDFQHHRLMAGYHALMAKKQGDEALDLHSSGNPDKNKDGKGKEGEVKRHMDLVEKHRDKAKSFHDPKKHGAWNSTVPSAQEAAAYGKKHVAELDKDDDNEEVVKDVKVPAKK